MANWLNAMLDPLKSAGEMASKLVEGRDTVKFGDIVIELQAQIMAAQQGAFAAQIREAALADEIRGLKERMADLEAWGAEKQRYQLTDFGDGTFAYLLKSEMSNGEPAHRLCAACYQKGHKSILQFQVRRNGQDIYDCPECKTPFRFGVYRPEPINYDRKGGPNSWMGA